MSIQKKCFGDGRELSEQVVDDLLLVIPAILQQRGPALGVEIQKLCFIADLYAVEAVQRRVTGADYTAEMHGPYSGQIERALTELSKESGVVQTSPTLHRGRTRPQYVYQEQPGLSIDGDRRRLIAHICEQTQEMGVENLKEVSKDNWLYRESDGGQKLDFGTYCTKVANGEASPRLAKSDVQKIEDELKIDKDNLLQVAP